METKLKVTICVLMLLLVGCLVAPTMAATDNETKPMIVGFKDKTSVTSFLSKEVQITENKKITQFKIIPAIAIELSTEESEELKKNPNVAYVEEDGITHITEEVLWWNVNRTGADRVWGIGGVPEIIPGNNAGGNVKIAFLDTGISDDHPDISVAGGISFIFNSDKVIPNDNWTDGHGHGTHVAGTAVLRGNDQGGIGIAPEAEAYAVKVIGDEGCGSTSDAISGIEWAVANDMDIISMSFALWWPSTSLEEACNNAYNEGIVLVAGAGNNGASVQCPASCDSVIAVSATTITDEIAEYSNQGLEIELAAPGSDILSASIDDGYYTLMSGTSMATPHVTGVVALLLNTPINDSYDANNNNQWDPDEVRQRLQDTATDMGAEGRDNLFGFGMVNAYEATNIKEDEIPNDWNPWNDNCDISNIEISMAEWHWVTDTPINGHIISNVEISLLEYQWVTGEVC